jgi:hypothetical protein
MNKVEFYYFYDIIGYVCENYQTYFWKEWNGNGN